MAGKRRQILESLKTIIDGITTVNGYNNTVMKNELKFFTLDEVPGDKFPAVTYITGGSVYVPLTQLEYTSGSSHNSVDGWLIGILAYVSIDEQDVNKEGSLLLAIEDMVEDIMKAVLADHTLGLSFVQNCYLTSVQPFTDFSDLTKGAVQVVFEVKYDFAKTEP